MQDKRIPVPARVAARVAERVDALAKLHKEQTHANHDETERGDRVPSKDGRTPVHEGGSEMPSTLGSPGSGDGTVPERREKPRYRRVVIDEGATGRDAAKPPEVLATQFPARRPNRRHSPRLTPRARTARRTP